ncbi:DEAD/DEAH box helicase family protein [Aggregatibacter actinomycetemcomitans]|uniref:DEAD/DEAH box helicase family protein n=1 Tax=Aggregatibacter actinomycetemcomitans TaxID=714 RepID=UPI0002400679|nr:DEAD/DEAH box helicase family protein [Aggregatibacter actinomycetemcomitans]EHK89717.1 putative type III restriction enzyme [Aggregatibacter actinomycetemcomitans RhAA1]KNE76817.1 type III restriction enzyme, res subunit [Aggregatibacter actinomycetemcomitans RhAA1]MBN6079959.1 DEAD/DEAH box helicase family protein [Aggregatibacter actinomycetemcomitans]
MSIRTQNYINGRLSLRAPQAESLARLKQALDAAPEMAQKERDVTAVLNTLKAEFPTLQDFEREFPSLCFALATGVGKTRLMGAFIAYLHLAHGINNFFVLAPNLTIYNKLIADFTPNTPKYVFKGISEFAVTSPKLITGDNYESQNLSMGMDNLFGEITINVFNISKINSEVRGGKEPKIKRMREVLGDSYFNYLSNLPDLVLLMDESHRYRAQAGMRAINELNPLFGLELTATPFVESTKAPIPFKNVIVDYPLARAMAGGFVKMPAAVTQRDFDAKNYTPEEIEKIKLEDGVRVHENTKVELLTYARENNAAVVKPFMLVIARDTTHAAQLLTLLESDAFYNGRYKGKVIQVDSSKSGKDEEEMIERLLAVESVDEPTEIVIHVNMLKEGWDVTNLYTIVPLRAANARTLIEQSIGRGLRLPYGKRTGVEVVDRLNIVAHDRFQEIIDEANKGDSVLKLQQVILDAPSADDKKVSVQVVSQMETSLGLVNTSSENLEESLLQIQASADYQPVFKTENEKRIARAVMETAAKYTARPSEAPTSQALLSEEIRQKIIKEVQTTLQPMQAELLADNEMDMAQIVAKTTEIMVSQTIDIPRITVVPSGEVSTGFTPFKLDVSSLHLQPGAREITIHNLHTNEQSSLSAELGLKEKRPEDYIVFALIDFEDIDYLTQADLLYDLAGQMVAHLHSYLSESEALEVLDKDRRLIAREIHAQMQAHFEETATAYEVRVSQGFSTLKPCNYTVSADEPVHSVRQTPRDVGKIKQMLFGGFTKCLYPLQKFDSDTERRFAVILERDAQKWFKPAQGQFLIYWKLGLDSKEYVPDFVVETEEGIWLAETKARNDLSNSEVLAKAEAAVKWCQHASDYALQHGGKAWRYVLIPHDEVSEAKRLADFLRFEKKVV